MNIFVSLNIGETCEQQKLHNHGKLVGTIFFTKKILN